MYRSIILLFLLLPSFAFGDLAVQFDAWARATAPGAATGAIYGEIHNHGDQAIVLKDVGFDLAGHAMVHRTVVRDGMMRMVHSSVELAPGESITLEPGGLHIMLMGLNAPLERGCRYDVTLKWDDGSSSHSLVTGRFGQSKKPDSAGQSCP